MTTGRVRMPCLLSQHTEEDRIDHLPQAPSPIEAGARFLGIEPISCECTDQMGEFSTMNNMQVLVWCCDKVAR